MHKPKEASINSIIIGQWLLGSVDNLESKWIEKGEQKRICRKIKIRFELNKLVFFSLLAFFFIMEGLRNLKIEF